MASYEIDNVKAEKANAMRRYNRQRKFKWVVQICAAFVVLVQSTTWLPVVKEIPGEFSRRFLSLFDSTFYVFMLVVVIVLVLYASSGQNEGKPNVYDEFRRNTESGKRIGTGEPPVEEAPFHDKHIVCSENAVSPVHDNYLTISTITKRTVPQVQSDSTVRADSEKAAQEKHYRRTKSEKFELRIGETSRRQLLRWETEKRREIVRPGEEPARRSFSRSVEKLNDDDFNRRVEEFIAVNKKILREESTKHESESSLALTLTP
ncbi:hypothetical protein FH972_013859 [Carpinus fangiana]|uniref:DUF4408 domain-containing protein n=1 Tax=Carpinus fangiana TaxID=176857 RepID=A0A5N6R8A4_9ROSI|nr:hypothetical protein FH972_013859 [Carpinus fangiana]